MPFYCPYCGEEELRPTGSGPGGWDCSACSRGFRLSFTGVAGAPRDASAAGGDS